MEIIFFTLFFLIIWGYIIYPIFLYFHPLKKISNQPDNFNQSVSIIITAHNEEKSIRKTIELCLSSDYSKDKFEIVVASDQSTDKTVEIASQYIEKGVRVVESKKRLGKANAQNEAIETIDSDIIAFCDANSQWENNTLKQLVSSLSNDEVAYVTGQLIYTNKDNNKVSSSEGIYWKYELYLRKLESSIHSVTAGNGAVYAVKRSSIMSINPLYNHDLVLPPLIVSQGYRAVYNEKAIAYERTGETAKDELNRKIRMLGRTWHYIINNKWIFNPLKMGWIYSMFMISHRLLRYSSGLLQFLIFIIPIFLLDNSFFVFVFLIQALFYLLLIPSSFGLLGKKMYTVFYLNLFHYATIIGFLKAITGRVSPFWKSIDNTRK